MTNDLGTLIHYAGALRTFLAEPLGERECLELVRDQLRRRASSFLHILRHGIYANRRSPYRRLLEHAGLPYSEAAAMVERDGVETALEALYDRGVRLTLDEFKAKTPIRRPGLVIETEPRDFDNCLATEHYESRTGGSRGPRRRLLVDLDLLRHEAAHTFLLLSEFGLADHPTGIWRELPPGIVGMKTFLRHAKLGRPVEKWFTHRQGLTRLEGVKFHLFTLATGLLSRQCGRPMPRPEPVPPGDARPVAAWLAEKKRCGSPALLDTGPASGARVCLATREEGLDIAGTFFRFSAEPYTAARARLVHEAGCRAASHYAASEVGHIGLACGDPLSVDEVHVMADKVGVIQRRKRIGKDGPEVGSLLITTVSTNCPKTMLNVELGDYGVLEHRRRHPRSPLDQPVHDPPHGQRGTPARTAADGGKRRRVDGRPHARRVRDDVLGRLSGHRAGVPGAHRCLLERPERRGTVAWAVGVIGAILGGSAFPPGR